MTQAVRLRAVFLLAVVAGGIVAAAWLVRSEALPGSIMTLVSEVRGTWWAPLAFVAAYAVANVLLVPATPLSLLAGAIWGWWSGGLLVLAASTFGSLAPYAIGRTGAPAVAALIGRRVGGMLEGLRREGFVSLLLMRLVPLVPYNVLNYAAGFAGISVWHYAAATFIGTVPGIFIITYLADSIRAGIVSPGEAFVRVLAAGVLVALLAVTTKLAAGRIRRRSGSVRDPDLAARSGVVSLRSRNTLDGPRPAQRLRQSPEEVMSKNPLVELAQSGQSIWYDQMVRSLVTEGTLAKMIAEDDLRGLTSNPTIFEKAIGGSNEYDDQLRELARAGKSRDEIYEALVVDDITRAADVFRPVYDRTKGLDGYVSLEVSPTLAHDTAATVAEARRLWALVGRPNLMVKVPATPEGIPAVRALIADGINVNVTLIFSRDVHGQVIDAYIGGLEDRAAAGKAVDGLASVASFFVSRIDTRADRDLGTKIASASTEERKELEPLVGKIAIANAKLAYQLFREKFSGARWDALRAKGARVQRPLWASTGTKNPAYSDVLYLDELIGPDTVNTVPPATYAAFRDHGRVRPSLEEDLDGARRALAALEKGGISLDTITRELTVEGVKSFAESFQSLLETIAARRAAVLRAQRGRESARLGAYSAAVDTTLARIEKEKTVARIWKKDAAVWKSDPAHAKIIANSLGWLRVVDRMKDHVEELKAFADEVRGEFDHVVVLGMGGSSLCSEVLRTAFGQKSGFPRLHVLDTTVPAAVKALERRIDRKKTLFIVASKSGTTTEPVMFHRYFYDRQLAVRGESAGAAFVAVTDPETQLGRDAARDRFRRTFVNPADIGGRYSALSLFGLVPAALAGVDIAEYLERAHEAMLVCSPHLDARENRGAALGAALAALALDGRDKVTVVASPTFAALGLWIEQLVAESTGKEGKGILPIAGEPLGDVARYGSDRVFVVIREAAWNDAGVRAKLDALEAAGHPVIEHVLEPIDLGDEFFIWEFATAVAGAVMEINPFDQPNVQESKDYTTRFLDEIRDKGGLSLSAPRGGEANLRIWAPDALTAIRAESRNVTDVLADVFGAAKPGDYVALQAFLAENADRNAILDEVRTLIRDVTGLATASGYGPRYLHSTGQLHKGGADNGIFIQIFGADEDVVPIPGEPFTFSQLKDAQALGDYLALEARGRRVLRVHIGRSITNGLRQFHTILEDALAARRA